MSGAFRDASAAIERAAMLERENEELRTELGELAKLRVEVEELEKLRSEVVELRTIARSENEGAYMKRLSEERDQLTEEVRELRARLGVQESELTRLRFRVKRIQSDIGIETFLERVARIFRPKGNGGDGHD